MSTKSLSDCSGAALDEVAECLAAACPEPVFNATSIEGNESMMRRLAYEQGRRSVWTDIVNAAKRKSAGSDEESGTGA